METAIATETITVTKYTLTLTDADIAAILVDPAPLQKQLRALRGETKRGRHGGRDIKIGRAAKEQAPAAVGKGAGKGKFAKVACPECRQPISQAQLANHRQKKHGVTAAASPASD